MGVTPQLTLVLPQLTPGYTTHMNEVVPLPITNTQHVTNLFHVYPNECTISWLSFPRFTFRVPFFNNFRRIEIKGEAMRVTPQLTHVLPQLACESARDFKFEISLSIQLG